MNRRDIQAFVERDWALVSAFKEAYWLEQKRLLGPAEGLRIADGLRRHAMSVRPEFPTPEDRAADFACHVRVREMLQRASAKRRG